MFIPIVMAALAFQEPRAEIDSRTVHPHVIEQEYQRVRDYTSLSVKFPNAIKDARNKVAADMSVFVTWTGQAREAFDGDHAVVLAVHSSSKTWEFIDNDSIVVLHDKGRVRPKVKRDGDVETGYVIESILADLTFADLKAMARSSEVEIAVGPHEIRLDGQQIAAIQDMVSRLSVGTEESDKIAINHVLMARKRREELGDAMDKAMEKARAAVKAIPKARRSAEANKVGFTTFAETFAPTRSEYRATDKEVMDIAKRYPEIESLLAP